MKTKMKVTLALLALGASALIANAQDAGRPPMKGHRPPPLPIVTALDANHDGVIDSNEIANASAALKTLDKNGDGQLTADEFLPPRPAQSGDFAGSNHRPPPSPVINALDANQDGVISADEIANAPVALLTLDQDGDGQLTRDEFIGPRPHMGPPPGQNGNAANGDRPAPPDDAPVGPPPGE
jgi:Ca2+-binding EF-hand superfamily protein